MPRAVGIGGFAAESVTFALGCTDGRVTMGMFPLSLTLSIAQCSVACIIESSALYRVSSNFFLHIRVLMSSDKHGPNLITYPSG